MSEVQYFDGLARGTNSRHHDGPICDAPDLLYPNVSGTIFIRLLITSFTYFTHNFTHLIYSQTVWSTTIPTISNPQTNCYRKFPSAMQYIDMLPDVLLEAEKIQGGSNIFFHETSCLNEEVRLKARYGKSNVINISHFKVFFKTSLCD